MKIDRKGFITLTPKESEDIFDLLETLYAMGGVYDEDFTRDCQRAGRYSSKILQLKNNL